LLSGLTGSASPRPALAASEPNPGPFVGIRTDGKYDQNEIAASGADWTAVGVSWAAIETQDNVFNFASLDAQMVGASNNGQRPVLVGVGETPGFVRALANTPSCLIATAQQHALFRDFMTVLVNRYSGNHGPIPDGTQAGKFANIKYWAIYNEVNNSIPAIGDNFGGCFGTVDATGKPTTAGPTNYATLLATVGPAIHAADPGARVVYAGLPSAQFIGTAPFCQPVATNTCPFDPAFFTVSLQVLRQLGAINQVDVTMLNYYSSHEINWGFEAFGKDLIGRILEFRQEMRNAGLSDAELKPIIIQESSFTDPYVVNGVAQVPDSTTDPTNSYNIGQRNYVPQVLARAASLKLLAIFWFKLQDTSGGGSGGDWPYGLKTTTGAAKPGYTAFQFFNSLIDRQDRFVRALTFSDPRLEGYEFLTSDNRRVQIVWRNKDPKAVSDPDVQVPYSPPGNAISAVTGPTGDAVTFSNNTVSIGFAPRFIFVGGCSPRPPFSITATPDGTGRLQVTVRSTTNSTTTPNAIQQIAFGTVTNGLIDVPPGTTGAGSGLVLNLPPGTTVATFFVRHATPGQTTVRYTITDSCGSWSTFAGGGANAF